MGFLLPVLEFGLGGLLVDAEAENDENPEVGVAERKGWYTSGDIGREEKEGTGIIDGERGRASLSRLLAFTLIGKMVFGLLVVEPCRR